MSPLSSYPIRSVFPLTFETFVPEQLYSPNPPPRRSSISTFRQTSRTIRWQVLLRSLVFRPFPPVCLGYFRNATTRGSSASFQISPLPCARVLTNDPFSMHSVSVDAVIRTLVELGPSAQMANCDAQAAYRNVPIHPSDRHLLGMRLHGNYSVDLVLPFGLRSVP